MEFSINLPQYKIVLVGFLTLKHEFLPYKSHINQEEYHRIIYIHLKYKLQRQFTLGAKL